MILNSDMWKIWGRFQSGSFSYNAQSHNFQTQIRPTKLEDDNWGYTNRASQKGTSGWIERKHFCLMETNTMVLWSQWDEKIGVLKTFDFIQLKSLFLPSLPFNHVLVFNSFFLNSNSRHHSPPHCHPVQPPERWGDQEQQKIYYWNLESRNDSRRWGCMYEVAKNYLVVQLQGSQVLASFRKLTLFHPLPNVP